MSHRSSTVNIEDIHDYAESGDLDGVKKCILNGTDVNRRRCGNKWTPLHKAAQHGHLRIVEYLVSQKANIDIQDITHETPLHKAANKGHLPVVKYLVSQKADIEINNKRDETPLHKAATNGHLPVVKYLVSQKADIDIKNRWEPTPLHKAAEHGHLPVVEYLVSQKANIDIQDHRKGTPLHEAAEHGHLPVVEFLVSQKANIDIQDKWRNTPLHKAAANGHLHVVEYLVSQKADINIKDDHDEIPLHKAATKGHLPVVKYLVSQKADIDIKNKWEQTPLHKATEQGFLSIVEFLVSQKATIDMQDSMKQTPLHKAALNGYLPVVKYLVNQKADIDIQDKEEETPLYKAATNGHLPVVEYLVSQKANIDIKDILRKTPLHKAAANGHLHVVEYLVSQKADINIKDKDKQTPLHKAVEYGDLPVVKYLVSQKADIDIQDYGGENALHIATRRGKLNIVEFLLDHSADTEARDNKNDTPLDIALKKYHYKIMKCLVYAGADISKTNKEHTTTLLHRAAVNEDTEFTEWLLQKNIDVNVVDKYGNTALHIAARNRDSSVAECLLNKNANMETRNMENDTPLDIALKKYHYKIMKCLVYAGADISETNKEHTTTLLHRAAVNEDAEFTEWLLQKNIDVNVVDKYDNTPLHSCVLSSNPNYKIAAILVLNGADFLSKNEKGETPYMIAKRDGHTRIARMFTREMKTGLPKEMRYLRNKDVDSFKNALRSGFYYSYLGKIMMVGNEGVGKTAITAILIGKKPSKRRKSTEGIDVHISRTAVDLDERKLIPKVLSVEEVAYRNLAMHKRYGKTSEDLKLVEDSFAADDDTEQMYPEVESDTFEKHEPGQFSPNKTDLIATEPSATKQKISVVEKFLQRLGIKEGDTITADMLKEGTMKSGKKGILTMNLAPVIILDFAGQRVFYSTHQSFLTYRGIYVLTINGSLQLDDEMKTESPIPGKYGKPTTRAYIEFWISSILTYSKGRSKMFPKILVVCTHKDCVPSEEIEEQRAYIYGEITKMFDGTPAMHHLVLDHHIFINAMDPNDSEVEVFKDALVDMMFQQPSWGEKIPKPWIHLEMAINKRVQNGKKILHRRQLEEINKENPIQILGDKDLEVFLKVHHSQGDIIYFPLPGLRDHIIVYPAYLVDAFKSIVTDKQFCVGTRLDMVKTMNNDGILKKDDLEKIWKTTKKFKLHQGHLILLMCLLDILAEPRTYHQETEELLPAEFFYVPSLVTKEDSSNFGESENLCKRSLGLSFKFHSIIVPSAVGFRFISCCVEMYDVAIYRNQKMLFSGMTVVDINKSLQLLIQVKKQRVDIFLIHEKSRFQIISDIATGIRECLNDTLYRISDSYKLSSSGTDVDTETAPFHLEFPCFHVDCPCYTPQREGWVCKNHSDNLEDAMLKWFTNREIEECSTDCQGVSQRALEETVSDLQIAKLVYEMDWASFREMLIFLGMKSSDIDAIEEDFNNNIMNVKFVCMREWRMKSTNCTLADVYNAIEKAGSNMHALCKVFRDKPLDASCVFQEREPTDKDLDRIANQVIRQSLLLSVQLGIDASYWLHKKEDGDKIIKINRDMLRKWRDEHRGGRKMRELAQACCNVGVNIGFILSDCYER